VSAVISENTIKSDVLVSILHSKKADESFLDECGHPKHASLHLKVSPISAATALCLQRRPSQPSRVAKQNTQGQP